MARSKQASKRKGRRRSLPIAGAAVALAFAGGASATTPTEHLPPQDTPRPVITLSEEEISDVNLATFMSSTRKTSSSANPCNLLAEAVAAAAAGAAQCALEAAAAAAAAEAAEAARCDPLAVVAAAVEAAAAAAGC